MGIEENPNDLVTAIKILAEEVEYKRKKLDFDALLAVRKAAAEVSRCFAEFNDGNMNQVAFGAIGEAIDYLDNALYHTRMIEPKLTEYFTGDEIDEYMQIDWAKPGEDRSMNIAVVYCEACKHNHQIELPEGALQLDDESVMEGIKRFHDANNVKVSPT